VVDPVDLQALTARRNGKMETTLSAEPAVVLAQLVEVKGL